MQLLLTAHHSTYERFQHVIQEPHNVSWRIHGQSRHKRGLSIRSHAFLSNNADQNTTPDWEMEHDNTTERNFHKDFCLYPHRLSPIYATTDPHVHKKEENIEMSFLSFIPHIPLTTRSAQRDSLLARMLAIRARR